MLKYFNKAALLISLMMAIGISNAHALPQQGKSTQEGKVGSQVVWAKPLAAKAIRCLFILPAATVCDVKEIDLRLDMTYETVSLWDAFHVGYDPALVSHPPKGATEEEVLSHLKSLLRKKWDVIVLANLDTRILPESLLSDILNRVSEGAGLLTAYLHDGVEDSLNSVLESLAIDEEAPLLGSGIGACAFPGSGDLDEIATVRRHEKGRIVQLDYPGDVPENHSLIQSPADPHTLDSVFEDNAYSFAIRALCLAADRLNPVRIERVVDISPAGPDDLEIPPDFYPEYVQSMRDSIVAQPTRPFRLELDRPADRQYEIQSQLRKVDSAIRILYQDTVPLARGEDAHLFEIPAGLGSCMLDVWLKTKGGIADWYTAQIDLNGWPEFTNLKLEKHWLLPNDSLEVRMDVRPVANQNRGGAIYIRATDNFDRVTATSRQPFSHHGGALSLRIHFTDLLASVIKLEVFALESENVAPSEWELNNAYREVRYLSVRRHPSMTTLDLIASVDHIGEYGQRHYLDTLAQSGVSVIHSPGGEDAVVAVARAGLEFLPALTRIASKQARDGLQRDPCFNDHGYRSNIDSQLREGTLKHWAGTMTRYSLGNRNLLCESEENICQCGLCLDAFQQSLQQEYGDFNRLNYSWGTQFGDWDFLELPLSMGPGQSDVIAPWIDFRVFMDRQFSSFHGWARSLIVATDKEASVGASFDADPTAHHGCHWPDLFRNLDFVAAEYTPLFLEKILSYGKANTWSGVVLKEGNDTDLLTWLPWSLALNQVSALWLDNIWSAAYGDSASIPWLNPDGTPGPALTVLGETVREIRDTAGPLLYLAKQESPKIGVYDSHSSRFFSEVNTDYFVSLNEAQDAVASLLHFNNHLFHFIDKARLKQLAPQSYAVLVLPLCRTLDEEERSAIQSYVEGGGAVIADVLPGVYDEHGIAIAENIMELLFGVRKEGESQISQAALMVSESESSGAMDAGWTWIDRSVQTQQGFALAQGADAPAWIINRHKNGNSLLLNYPFRNIQQEKSKHLVPAECKAMDSFMTDLSTVAATVKTKEAGFLGRVYAYSFGESKIYAAQADMDAPRQQIQLPFNASDVVYNVLTGEQIRRPHHYRFRLESGEVQLFAALAYKVETLVLEAPDVAAAGQRIPIRCLIKVPKDKGGKHAFLLDFMPQNKSPLPYYRQCVDSDIGFAEMQIPLALNQIPGRYTIRVRDMLTGMVAEQSIKIATPVK
ncbi:MAG: beta-galactosidase [Candidatus Hydrogenedentales bacterium]